MKNSLVLLMISVVIVSCSGLEHSEKAKIRKRNETVSRLSRRHDERYYPLEIPKQTTRAPYEWEKAYASNLPRITKEYFRCRGNSHNPSYGIHKGTRHEAYLFDCDGGHRHSLPLRNGKEFIYPILIDLLNYVQEKSGKKVIITCGHRCPKHNTYSDAANSNIASKHQVGQEVDFYVDTYEEKPHEIIDLLMQFYREDSRYATSEEYTAFKRWDRGTNVAINPWYNKEVFIKLFQRGEGRDFDNSHSYPYIAIQVRYDRDLKARATYTWEAAHHNYQH